MVRNNTLTNRELAYALLDTQSGTFVYKLTEKWAVVGSESGYIYREYPDKDLAVLMSAKLSRLLERVGESAPLVEIRGKLAQWGIG